MIFENVLCLSSLKILNNLFDVAQGKDKKLELDEYEFDLHRAVQDVVHLLKSEANKKNIARIYNVRTRCLIDVHNFKIRNKEVTDQK